MPTRYKILRTIPEEFEVVASSYEAACDMIGEGQVEESVPLDDRYEQVEEEYVTTEAWVKEILEARGLPYKSCGLNADWCVSAWHLSKDTPNMTSGHYYLLDIEETDEDDEPLFEVVRRTFTAEDMTGNDTIERIIGPWPLIRTLDEWRVTRDNHE